METTGGLNQQPWGWRRLKPMGTVGHDALESGKCCSPCKAESKEKRARGWRWQRRGPPGSWRPSRVLTIKPPLLLGEACRGFISQGQDEA